MSGWKVRIGDGSEIGPMDLAALRSWLAQGLVDAQSPVMRPGSRKWVPLGSVPELKGAYAAPRPQAAPRSRARGARPAPEAVEPDEPTGGDAWRLRIVGVVLVVAAGALGSFAWRPETAAPTFDGAPWLEVALGTLALGLALLPGWDLARRLVRIGLLVAAFALFPLAGILIAQGERGAGLLALGGAWLFVSGLAALLPRTIGRAGLALALLPVLLGAYAAARYGRAPASDAARSVREWALPDARFTDDSLGLSLELPEGWVALKPGNPLVTVPSAARVTLAQPRHDGFGYVVTGPAPRGVANADQYLDHVLALRRAERPGLEPGLRANALVGALSGRRLDSTRADGGVRHREVIVAGLDGWMGFALVAWMPEASASRADGLDALVRGLAARGLLAARLQQAVEAAVAGVPHLTAASAEQLMSQTEARVLDPEQAFRRSLAALAQLLPTLSRDETRELAGLASASYAGLPWSDRTRLASYVERVRRGDTTSAEEDREMAALMRAGEERLSPARRLRLQAYYEKAILANN